MPPAIIAIAAAVATAAVSAAAAGAFVAIGITISATLAAILTIAIAVAAQIAISLGRKPTSQRTNQGEELKLKLDPGMPRQLPLGRCATGGSVVWSFTYGSTADVPTNAYLVRVIALSDLPCSALVGVYEGKTQLTFAGSVTSSLAQCNQHASDDGTPCMWVQVHLGSPTPTADGNLVSWSGGLWTTAHKGTNMAYAVVRYLYDGEGNAFPNGEPQLIFVLDGVLEYDQRQDSTRGGRTGTQRLADPTTWAFSRNASVIAQQVLRGFYSNGVLLLGAQAEDKDLDDAMLLSAYNTSDEVVSYSGGTQPRYRAGYMASCSTPVVDVLVQLQAAFDGRIIDRGGNITLRPGATHTPVFNLTDADLIWDAEKSWQPRLALSEIYNFVDGVFVDEATIFNEKPFPPLKSAAYEIQDGNQRFEYQIGYSAVTDWAQVQRMTKRIHLQSRLQGTVAFYLPLWALEMEQDDWFTLTSARWGFTNKYFAAVSCDLIMSPGLMIAVIGREMDPNIDGWDPAVDEKARGDTTWTGGSGPSAPPTPILNPSPISKISINDGSETFGVRIGVANIGGKRSVGDQLEIQIALQSNLADAVTLGTYPSRNGNIEAWGLISGLQYAVRGRTYNSGKVGTWGSWANFTTGLSILNYFISVLTSVVFQANTDGTLNPTSQLPKVVAIEVAKNNNSIKTSNSVSYTITPTGCSATVNNTNGSAQKGQITITAFPGWSATIDVNVVANGFHVPTIRMTLQKSISATSGGTGSTGGSGSKTASDPNPITITGITFIALSQVMTITLAAGESLYGTGSLDYTKGGSAVRALNGKWQYSPTGAGTWTDFPGGTIIGSGAYTDADTGEAISGNILMYATKGGLAAATYDVRAVAKVDGSPGTLDPSGTLTITAKV
jgi:hypothetical protein